MHSLLLLGGLNSGDHHHLCYYISLLKSTFTLLQPDLHSTVLLLLLSCFSHIRLCATSQTATHQALPSLGFSRQEHWSGLPFPSPMHEIWKVKVKLLSHVWLFATPWTAAYQAPLSMGFSRQEYWSGLPLPSPTAQPKYFQIQSEHFSVIKTFKTFPLTHKIQIPWLGFY